MTKKIILILLLSVVMIGTEPLTKEKCEKILNKSGIDFDIRTNAGWKRVCNNNKIKIYVKNSNCDLYMLCKCINKNMNDNYDRSIGNIREIGKIGEKIK